jgi:hypothetical protein
MSVNVLYQTSTRATAGRDDHGLRIYPQQMRGSSIELRATPEMSEIAVSVSWQ